MKKSEFTAEVWKEILAFENYDASELDGVEAVAYRVPNECETIWGWDSVAVAAAGCKVPYLILEPTFPKPPEGQEWHNPDKLTPAQVELNKGYRLLLKSEINAREQRDWCDRWTPSVWYNGYSGNLQTRTYRTKEPLPGTKTVPEEAKLDEDEFTFEGTVLIADKTSPFCRGCYFAAYGDCIGLRNDGLRPGCGSDTRRDGRGVRFVPKVVPAPVPKEAKLDENEFEFEGVKLKAVPSTGCTGCHFTQSECVAVREGGKRPACDASMRTDHTSVVFSTVPAKLDENEFEFEGVKLKAVTEMGCGRCYFMHRQCGDIRRNGQRPPCRTAERADRKSVVFVLAAPTLATQVDAELSKAAEHCRTAADLIRPTVPREAYYLDRLVEDIADRATDIAEAWDK
jgi:hypothetical protein